MIKYLNFLDIKQDWTINCPVGISLEFYMENYCRKFIPEYKEVHVKSQNYTFVFK